MRMAPSARVLALPLGVACAGAVPGSDCTRAAAVQEIVWEQDCSGCAEGLRLRFGRDGRAVLTVTGTTSVQELLSKAGFQVERVR